MELPKQFYDAANSKVKPDDGEWGEGYWAGYTDAAMDVLNAVEAKLKERISEVIAKKKTSPTIEAHACYLQEQKGLENILSDLSSITPLKS